MFQVKDPQGVLRPFSFRNYNKYPVGKDDNSLRHIWYSKQQAEMVETIAIYRLADFSVDVDVTTASETTKHGCLWDDMVYLGVGWYVRSKDNDKSRFRGFNSDYTSLRRNPCKEVNLNGDVYDPALFEMMRAELARVEAAKAIPTTIIIDSYSQLPPVIEDRPSGIQPYAYGNSYRAARESMGDHSNHSGVDAVEPEGHPDNPVFLQIPSTFQLDAPRGYNPHLIDY